MKRKYSIAVFFISIFLVQLFFFLTALPSGSKIQMLFLAIFLSATLVQLYMIIMRTLDDARADTELSMLKEQQRLEAEHLESFREHQEEAVQIQKNMAEGLNRFQSLLEKGEYSQARQCLDNITDTFQKDRYRPCCQDNLLNAILESKRKIAAKSHIKVHYEILLPEKTQISQTDLSSVFFNLLDNAIDACTHSGAEAPEINLSVNAASGFLSIHMRNTKDANVPFRHTTTKSDAFAHGFGLSIIEDICKRNDGTCQWEDHGDTFDSVVLMRL